MPTSARIRLGDRVAGRYVLRSVARRGGLGVTYDAFDERSDRQVQVTVLYARLRGALDRAGAPRVLQAVARLEHQALLPLIDAAAAEEPVAFIASPVPVGRPLSAVLEDGPLETGRALALGADVAGALAALHAQGMVHRAVRPASIAVGDDGAVLLDAGLADVLDLGYYTAYERLFGTAAYVAPEQVWNAPVGPAADVYALGLVLIECLTGEPAFPGSTAADAVTRTSASPAGTALPAGPAALLERMTAIEPGARPTAAEVAEALRPRRSPTPLRRAATRARGAGRRAVPAAAAATVVLIAMSAGVLLAGGSSGAVPRAEPDRAPSALPPAGFQQDLRAVLQPAQEVPAPVPAGAAAPRPTPEQARRSAPSPVARAAPVAEAASAGTDQVAEAGLPQGAASAGHSHTATPRPAAPAPRSAASPQPSPSRPSPSPRPSPSAAPSAFPSAAPTPSPAPGSAPTATATPHPATPYPATPPTPQPLPAPPPE